MEKLIDKLWKELEELDEKAEKEKLSVGDVEMTKTIASALDHLDRVCGDNGGYSRAGNWEAVGRMNGTYGGGSSYANHGRHLVRAHYSRAGGHRDSRGRYSGSDGFREMLEDAMESAPDEQTRMKLERMMRDM